MELEGSVRSRHFSGNRTVGGLMASRLIKSCSPWESGQNRSHRLKTDCFQLLRAGCCASALLLMMSAGPLLQGQILLKPVQPGEPVTLMPSDMTVLEAAETRRDLPCLVTQRKADLGFDLKFHSGYEVSVPLHELSSGGGELLSIVFRAYPQDDQAHAAYFVQHFRVPVIEDEAKGDAVLQGIIDVGPGKYHVDWLMRDRSERVCASSWDVEAALPPKDRPMPLFIDPNQITEATAESFTNDSVEKDSKRSEGLKVKLLVNFAPQKAQAAALQRSDTDALVTILKEIERDPQVDRVTLVAFNMDETRIVYRQDSGERIDFPSLGKALQSMKLGTVNIAQLNQKHSETDFLTDLIQKEVSDSGHPDAVIFAGPKAMLDADVPQQELRRVTGVDCPVFYMNYNLNPQAVPWKDSISHAIKAFKGTEYTISRPRDLWFSTTEMLRQITRNRHQRAVSSGMGTGMSAGAQ